MYFITLNNELTIKEMKLMSKLLEIAANEFVNHICNDCDGLFDNWSQEEMNNLEYKICEWNNSPDEYDPECPHFDDWILMSYFADVIGNKINE